MQRIFYPQSIVVIGVSERPDNLARNIIANLHAFGYLGKLYAVGRHASRGQVNGIPIVTSLDQVPDGLDLAVILTPAATVPDLMEACGCKGIHRVVIESGGFSEFSPAGHRLEKRLVEVARRWNIRFVGPNCISVINLETGLCLPFAPLSPRTTQLGPASVIAQSGGVSITYVDRLCTAGVGVNKAISIGNKTDLDESDYLAYLLQDPGTEIICLYLESIGNGRKLMDLARASTKPIIVHKANRGQASQRVALSHTAALADDDQIVSAAFRQAGILRAESFQDTIAAAQGLALPPVRGNDLVVISRSGGHAVIAADAAERYGFRLAPLPQQFTESVRAHFRADVIALTNPLDLGVIFDFDLYARIVQECLEALAPDAILLINTYSSTEAEGAHRLARRVDEIVRKSGRPIAFCVYSQGDETQMLRQEISLPVFAEIEEALRGLAASRQWNQWRTSQHKSTTNWASVPPPEAVRLRAKPGVLTAEQTLALCQAYGIPVAPWEVAASPEKAARAADRLGYPVALKVLAAEVVHKSDVGGVALELADAASVRQEAEAMLARVTERMPEAKPVALMVQRIVSGGVEVILGGKWDHSFGPVVMFGLGGTYVEAFDDVAFRVAPLSRADAEEMIGQVRGKRLLEGLRGKLPVDRLALIQALHSLSRLLVENPCITEVDVNPLCVLEKGVVAVDARAVTVK
jgi:acetyltransferase